MTTVAGASGRFARRSKRMTQDRLPGLRDDDLQTGRNDMPALRSEVALRPAELRAASLGASADPARPGRARPEAQAPPVAVAAPPKPLINWGEVWEYVREARDTRLDRKLFFTTFIAVTVGIVFVFSASFPRAGRPVFAGGKEDPYSFLRQQAFFAVAGLVLMLATSYLRPAMIRRIAGAALLLCMALMAVCVCLAKHNGAAAWLGDRGQPSEFGKLAYLLYLAGVIAGGADWRENRQQLKTVAWTMGAMCVILYMQNDLGMAMLIVGITFGLLFLRGTQGWLLGSVSAGLIAVVVLAVSHGGSHFTHVRDRVEAWLHPEQHLRGDGGHIVNMLATTTRGGLVGEGLGMCADKWKSLFAPHTDAIFCVIAGELGLWGAAALLFLLCLIPFHCFRIAARTKDDYAWLLAAGVGGSLGFQTLINVAVATNSMPCTGLTLPFISAGGSSLVASMISVGVVLSVARWNRPQAEGR